MTNTAINIHSNHHNQILQHFHPKPYTYKCNKIHYVIKTKSKNKGRYGVKKTTKNNTPLGFVSKKKKKNSQTSLCGHYVHFERQTPRSGKAGSHGKFMFNFLRNCHSFSKIAAYFTFLHSAF